MEARKDQEAGSAAWMSVPAFGDWDQKAGPMPDYSVDFTKIREMRKQNKKDFSRASVGNEEELIPHQSHRDDHGVVVPEPHRSRPARRKKIMSYFNCCMIGA